MTIRIVIVDDQAVFRRGLRVMLELDPGIEVVGEAENGRAGIDAVHHTQADAALVDARMPKVDGPDMIAALKRSGTTTKLLILTTFEDDDLLLRGLRAGADGYLLKDSSPEEIIEAVHRVTAGETVLGQDPLTRLVALTRNGETSRKTPEFFSGAGLTTREAEIAHLISQGYSNREIARTLYISEGTVKNHITNVLRKLSLRDRTQLAAFMSS